jgi:peptidoglycan/xylan/chitin deacetylase (PgdA/CDA1 family)
MNFRVTSILFLISIVVLGILHYFFSVSLWWIVLPVLIYKALIIYGSANICSDFYLKVHCNSETKEKVIAISFDDGPNKEFTPAVLNVLAEFDVPATFFLIGKNIEGNEALVKEIDLKGHIIGNHTYSHSFFIDFKGRKAFIDEMNKTMALVYKITGRQMRFFRPPYGVTTPHLANAAKDLDYSVIGWNIRSLDTTKDPDIVIFERIKKQLCPGAIILFHDTSSKTVNVLRQTLNFAKENGFKIVSTERLLNLKAYEI